MADRIKDSTSQNDRERWKKGPVVVLGDDILPCEQ